MIRFLLRFIGLLLLALAFIFVVYDGIRTISDGTFQATRTSYVWSAVHDTSLKAFQTLVEKNAGVEAWQIGVVTVIDQPASLIFCVLGIIFILLGRKKKPLIGYARD